MFVGARAALLEVFCGAMELTLGARSLGLCVPDGVDALFPVGERPWDLLKQEDRDRCRALEDRVDPVVIHYAPPCTKLCSIGPRPPPGHPDFEDALCLVDFSVEGIERRILRNAEGSMESPYAAGTWGLEKVQGFFGTRTSPKEGRYFASPDLCQFGMKEPGQEDVYWKKRITLAATYEEIRIVELQCDGSHLHQVIRGNVKTTAGWKS